MDGLALFVRMVIIILFAVSAVVSVYAAQVRRYAYHLYGIAGWCVHIIAFTIVATLHVAGWIDINPLYLNLWSSTVRLHGGIVTFSVALHYASKVK